MYINKDTPKEVLENIKVLKFKEQDLKVGDDGRDNLDLFMSYCIT
jgi:hypothetical protein